MKITMLFVWFLLVVIQEDVSANKYGIKYHTPKALGSFGEGAPVYGVYREKDLIYAVRDSTPYIETFSATGGNEQQQNVTLEGTQGPYDIVGNAQLETLYLLDWFNWNYAITVSLESGNRQSQFSLQESEYSSFTLSASHLNTIIATCSKTQIIKEFSPAGQLVFAIYVNIEQPRHTIRLQRGAGLVVCHGYGPDQLHRVCHISDTGYIRACYGSTPGSEIGHLDVPSRVLEDDYGNIWVADQNNKRIVVLSPSLEYVATLLTAEDGLQGPYRMLLDGQRLYISDNTVDQDGVAVSGRVLVFDIQP